MNHVLRLLAAVFLIGFSIASALVFAEALLRQSSLSTLRSSIVPRVVFGDRTYNTEENMADLAINFPTSTHYMIDQAYDYWSNNIGCFDTAFATGTKPYIYLAGDSFTWGFAPFEDKWGTLMEHTLGLRVAKCGVRGWGTAQELIKARHIIERIGDPSMIVVGYFNNDPSDDADFAKHPVENSNNVTPIYSGGLCAEADPALLTRWQCWLDQYSVIFTLMKYELQSAPLPPAWKDHVYNFFNLFPRRALTSGDYNINEQSILNFRSLAFAHHAQILFVLIPARDEVINPTATSSSRSVIIKEFLAREHIPTIDLYPEFHKRFMDQHLELYWTHDPHWNIAGNHLAAELVAKFIIDNKLAPIRPAAPTINGLGL